MTIDTNAPVEQKQNNESANIAEMRRLIGEEKKARQAAEERANQLEAEKQQRFKASLPYKDDDVEDDSEPYVDHKKLNKKLAAFEQNFEKKVDAKAETIARTMIEQERQASFLKSNPDFNQILSPEIIQKFVDKHPELAEPMLDMPEGFSRQKLLYQNIKALGINRPAMAEPSIQQKIDANRKSPYYQPSGGNTPPYSSQSDFSANGQKNAYAKMQELINNRRG